MTEHPEPTTIKVVDNDGNTMWASRHAPFILDGLADGTLREVPDAAVPPPSPHLDTHVADDGSGERQPDTGATDDSGDDSVAGAETDRGTRRRR